MLVGELGEIVCWFQTNLDQAPDDVSTEMCGIYLMWV